MEHNPILKNPLSLDSEIPLYSQLMGIIKRSITSGALNAIFVIFAQKKLQHLEFNFIFFEI